MSKDSRSRFSKRVDDYVKYRPGYPEQVVHFIADGFGIQPGAIVADIGAGTGISTALFLDAGYKVFAVEPNKEMRDKCIELLDHIPAFTPVDGAAEETSLEAGTIDLIVCGQAFHWFDINRSATEFRRILKPDGVVALIWNERETVSAFEKEYDELIVTHATDYVQVDHRNTGAEKIEAFFDPFPVQFMVFANQQVFDMGGLTGRLLSSSYMPSINDNGYADMVTDLEKLFNKYQENGAVTIHYATKVYAGVFK